MTDKTYEAALQCAMEYVRAANQSPVGATASLNALREKLNRRLVQTGVPAAQVIRELAADVQGGLVKSAGGRFFAWVIGGALPSALAADWLCSAWDQNAGLCATAPAAAVVEEIAGAWLKDLLHLPAGSSFAFVTGCQMAHFTCLLAAREAVLRRQGWDLQASGLSGAPAIRVFAGDCHGTVERALRLLGIGLNHLTRLPANQQAQLDPEALRAALAQQAGSPAIVVLQAGEINTGAYDDFSTLIPIAHERGAWVHVDGAFGLWAAASPRYRHLLRGVEMADSWAVDGHKWLNVPYDCGYAFVADSAAHRATMSYRGAYLTHSEDARDQMDWNPEWSRRARGFPTYAAIRELGRDGIAALIDRCCRHASELVDALGQLPHTDVLWRPIINQGLVRFRDPRPGASDEDHDRRTDEVIARINETGEAFFSGSTWRGRRVMRVSVCNWQTTEEDVRRTAEAVRVAIGN
jgi:glutamate/tyrosine decarboxylase-like PLP-dependent enzyme